MYYIIKRLIPGRIPDIQKLQHLLGRPVVQHYYIYYLIFWNPWDWGDY